MINFRIYNISFLTISTADKVYVFDLPALNSAKTISELESILSSDSHLKVIHDSRNIVENFKAKFKVELQPVFDVMLSAAQFYSKEDVLKLESCVKTVLGIDVEIGNDKAFPQRPLTQSKLLSITNKSAFLLPIYHKLASKSFSKIFKKNEPRDDIEDFFNSLGLTDIEKLEKQSQKLQVQEVDFSIYHDSDNKS